MRLTHLFKEPQTVTIAHRLYATAVEQARHPAFYLGSGVPDTPDGRFDMIAVHVALLLRRLRKDHAVAAEVAQALFDLMFADMDQNLREMGIGDIGVGKRVKAMAQAFYGRLSAYDSGLDSAEDGKLTAALKRNLYRKTAPCDAAVAALAAYVRREAEALDALGLDQVMRDGWRFGPPPGLGGDGRS